MTNDQINKAIADDLGWKPVPNSSYYWYRPGETLSVKAEFTDSYDAVAEMRNGIRSEEQIRYVSFLMSICKSDAWDAINATPRQQAEAFLKMRGKWVDHVPDDRKMV